MYKEMDRSKDRPTSAERSVYEKAVVEKALGDLSSAIEENSLEIKSGASSGLNKITSSSSDKEIAKVLSETVVITDPNLVDIVGETKEWLESNKPKTGVEMVYAIAGAKARAAGEKVTSSEIQNRLQDFENNIFNEAGKALTRVGGKKTLALVGGLSLAATACGTNIEATPTPAVTPIASVEVTQEVISYKASISNSSQEVADSFNASLSEQEKEGIVDYNAGGVGLFTVGVEGDGASKDISFALFKQAEEAGGEYRMAMNINGEWVRLSVEKGDVLGSDEQIIVATYNGEPVLSWNDKLPLTEMFLDISGDLKDMFPGHEGQDPLRIPLGTEEAASKIMNDLIVHEISWNGVEAARQGKEGELIFYYGDEAADTLNEKYKELQWAAEDNELKIKIGNSEYVIGTIDEENKTLKFESEGEEIEFPLEELLVNDRGLAFRIKGSESADSWHYLDPLKREWTKTYPKMSYTFLESLSEEELDKWFGKLELTQNEVKYELTPSYDDEWGIVWKDENGEIRLVDYLVDGKREPEYSEQTVRRFVFDRAGRLVVLTSISDLKDYFDISNYGSDEVNDLLIETSKHTLIKNNEFESFIQDEDGDVVLVYLDFEDEGYIMDTLPNLGSAGSMSDGRTGKRAMVTFISVEKNGKLVITSFLEDVSYNFGTATKLAMAIVTGSGTTSYATSPKVSTDITTPGFASIQESAGEPWHGEVPIITTTP